MHNMEHIEPGDQVVVGTRLNDSLATVDRITKTQIILADGSRYRRADGNVVGRNEFSINYIRKATDQDRTRIIYRTAVQRAEMALHARRVEGVDRYKTETYKTRLLEAKEIIDAALGIREGA